MKTKKIISLIAGFICYFFFREIIFPYDNINAHPTFNETIIKFLEENSQKYFPSQYSINISQDVVKYKGTAVTNPGFTVFDYGETDVEYTVHEWIKHGGYSADEPELAASVRHFYDPVGLNGGKKYLTNRGTYWEGAYSNPGIDAIEWALGDTPKGVDNLWSLKKGKDRLAGALEVIDPETRNNAIAKAFRCLGEVLHNTADMGCPPHTMNDSHAAPIGYTGGVLLGSPDPNEELFNIKWISSYMYADPDPNLKSFCENATTIRSIHEKLAEFTNANFYTSQTFYGVGKDLVKPINKEGNYSSPLLQDLEYDASSFTYYKTFQSGNKVKMAKDRSFFIFRGYPYIDRECVMSQASELVPNLICAGANVVRLFVPNLKVKISSVKADGEINGTVAHTPTAEYNSKIYYSGKINIYDYKSLTKLGTLECNTGDFKGTIIGLKTNDEIYASLELGGVKIRSEIFQVGSIDFTIVGCSIVLRNLTADFTKEYPIGTFTTEKDQTLSMGFPKDTPDATVSFLSGETPTLTQEYTNYYHTPDKHFYSEKITLTFGDKDLSYISSFSAEWKREGASSNLENKLSAKNIPRDNSVSNMQYKLKGLSVCNNIISLHKKEDYGPWTYTLIDGSWKCNENAEIVVYISTQ